MEQETQLRIETSRLILRTFVESDHDDLYEFLSQLRDDEFEGYPGITYNGCKEHLAARLGSEEYFAIELRGCGKVIGNIYCGNRDFAARELGYILNRDYQGRGYACEALSAVIANAFREGAHRVYARCDPRNVPSWKLLERTGLRREAHLRQDVFFHTTASSEPIWKDTFVYALLADEWNESSQARTSQARHTQQRGAHAVEGQPMPRRAAIEDIPALCEARERQLVDEGLRPDAPIGDGLRSYFESALTDGSLVEWVLEEEGVIVATAAITFMPFPPTFSNPIGTRGYVTNMYTAPSHRGRGIASRLLGLLMDEARQRGVRKIVLHASKMGRPVYERHGFQPVNGWMELDL